MVVLAEFKVIVFINYWILSFNQFHFISGSKPHCRGDPLSEEEFSGEGDVGLVRDICVDIIARNIYDELGYQTSKSCEDLANVRTSTCTRICQCKKWKRSSYWNKGVTNRVMTMAEALMKDLIEIGNKYYTHRTTSENSMQLFIFERIIHAKRRLIQSRAADQKSKIVGQIEDLKGYFAPANNLFREQIEYQESIGRSDVWTLMKLGYLFKNEDLTTAINEFKNFCKAKTNCKILSCHIQEDFLEKPSSSGILRLEFEYYDEYEYGRIYDDSVILKIPSFASSYDEKLKYDREIYFYENLLPALYQLGKCKPFAPNFYVATEEKALVLEDLTVDGYKKFDREMFLDLDHSQMSLDVLAKYHAIGYTHLQNLKKDASSIPLIEPFQYATNKKDLFDKFCEALKSHLNDDILYEKILKMEPEILANLPTARNLDKNSMTVIIHGDFNKGNILFKYDTAGNICEAKIIDWQTGRKASPLVDLIEFFVCNIDIADFKYYGDTLIDYYLDRLVHNLSLLSTTRVYNRIELDNDMVYFKYSYFNALLTNMDIALQLSPEIRKEWELDICEWIFYLEEKKLI